MGKIAFVFPGQGAQTVGMGKDLYDNYAVSKNIFDTADKVLNKSITKLCFDGPEEDLKQTINTQPAILTTSIAILEAFKEKTGITPDYTAGHSLGEYAALYCAGVLSLEDTFKIIQKRAEVMNTVASGTMSAIIGLPQEKVETAVKQAQKFGYVDIANYNSPIQIVITGEKDAVEKAGELLKEAGARRVVPLAVSGAFHSEIMKPAAEEFKNYINNFDIKNAVIPVITNTDALETTSGAEFKEKMPKQIYSSVHWTQTINKMYENGVNTIIEIGPGQVLSGLIKKINPEIKTFNIACPEHIDSIAQELQAVI